MFYFSTWLVPSECYSSAGKLVTPLGVPVVCVQPIQQGWLQELNCWNARKVLRNLKQKFSKWYFHYKNVLQQVSILSSLSGKNWDCGDQQPLSSCLLPTGEEAHHPLVTTYVHVCLPNWVTNHFPAYSKNFCFGQKKKLLTISTDLSTTCFC